ncbi:alpha/beta hydrolase family protein [Dyadobacter subterraneus]|uniref:Alpha/beta fold hydrolase n=1 Tax=Dyadobacter subterraneus TaxID=2773304 RepID=A0ABR9WLE4_9BACT|nr:alpha/beta fold hydrolase [Dyadobacter subterraneus]MBE9466247.1 alpha/beta fold hydrolase [Dyadobacter subterraneus]
MKNTLLSAFLILISFTVFAQDISGQWNGILKLPGAQLRLVVNFTKTPTGFSATLDSPDQGANGIPVNTVDYSHPILKLTMTSLNAEYSGALDAENNFKGIFKQNGQAFPLDLSRKVIEKVAIVRPQDPVKPYPYYSEDVKFLNEKDKITLAGTLTLPKKEGNYPAVILISGSGPQNRDEELAGHKPFLVLSDYLTKNGIAVLRYDDRGTAQSTGDFALGTTKDFASDVESAIAYLKTRKEINNKKIGLIGHSEGGLIAPMVAVDSKDVAFIVLLAGPGLTGEDILIKQSRLIGKANGLSDDELNQADQTNKKIYGILKEKTDLNEIKKELTVIFDDALNQIPAANQPPAEQKTAYVSQAVNRIATPWFKFFVSYDPVPALEKVKCPVLAFNGEKDLQVPPKEDLETIKMALEKGGNKNVTTKLLPNLNHLFQESTTGSPTEYDKIEQTFSPVALIEISDWIKKTVLK